METCHHFLFHLVELREYVRDGLIGMGNVIGHWAVSLIYKCPVEYLHHVLNFNSGLAEMGDLNMAILVLDSVGHSIIDVQIIAELMDVEEGVPLS